MGAACTVLLHVWAIRPPKPGSPRSLTYGCVRYLSKTGPVKSNRTLGAGDANESRGKESDQGASWQVNGSRARAGTVTRSANRTKTPRSTTNVDATTGSPQSGVKLPAPKQAASPIFFASLVPKKS